MMLLLFYVGFFASQEFLRAPSSDDSTQAQSTKRAGYHDHHRAERLGHDLRH
jgi:hypothetical protein